MRVVAWMSGTLVSVSLMAVCARELSGDIPTAQTLFLRSLIGLVCLLIILSVSSNQKIVFEKLGIHTVRNVFHFIGQYGWFYGIGFLPLSKVFALEFTVPIWTLIIASLALGEKITFRKVVSILLGSIGVIVILQPGFSIIDKASFIVLGSAICFAISHSATKSLSSSQSVISILFFMCLMQLVLGLAFSINSWIWPTFDQWFWLLILGPTALTVHFCISKAMQCAEATTVVTIDFIRLPFITLVGVLFYSEQFELALIIGAALMLLGNIIGLKQSSSNK